MLSRLGQEDRHVLGFGAGVAAVREGATERDASGDRSERLADLSRLPRAQPEGMEAGAGHRVPQLPGAVVHPCLHGLGHADEVRIWPVRRALSLDEPNAGRRADLPESPLAEAGLGPACLAAQEGCRVALGEGRRRFECPGSVAGDLAEHIGQEPGFTGQVAPVDAIDVNGGERDHSAPRHFAIARSQRPDRGPQGVVEHRVKVALGQVRTQAGPVFPS
jgi:hypothetical protein